MAKVLVIPCDESKPLRLVEAEGFEEYRKIADIEWLEACFPREGFFDVSVVAYVDEEGLIKDLPFNGRLMNLFLNANSGLGLRGDGIVLSVNRAGDDMDVPKQVISACTRRGWTIQNG